ncbi:MAG: hypothetical protein ABI425_04210 [Patescibacteria group bacterium]
MAAPATHIILADKIFEKYFQNTTKSDFYIGTSFPDIRYLGVIDREKTHFIDLSIQALISLPPFEAGLKFHSLVDKVREKFMRSQNVYSLVPESPFITQALKFFEDEVLYEKRNNWNEIASYFGKVTNEESCFGIKTADIEKWHKFLQTYFTTKPHNQNIREFVAAINKPKEMAKEIIRLTEIMEDNIQLKRIVLDFYNHFGDLLTDL